MKELSLILSALSLTITLGLAVGAYITYKKAEDMINNPEKLIDQIVEHKMNDLLKNLPLPKSPIKDFKIF
jgi:uncharacterized protein YneF (UPF0154 family)